MGRVVFLCMCGGLPWQTVENVSLLSTYVHLELDVIFKGESLWRVAGGECEEGSLCNPIYCRCVFR